MDIEDQLPQIPAPIGRGVRQPFGGNLKHGLFHCRKDPIHGARKLPVRSQGFRGLKAQKGPQLIGMQDQDVAFPLNGAGQRLQAEGLPLRLGLGISEDVPREILDMVSRKKLFRRGAGRSADSRVESKFRSHIHRSGSLSFSSDIII